MVICLRIVSIEPSTASRHAYENLDLRRQELRKSRRSEYILRSNGQCSRDKQLPTIRKMQERTEASGVSNAHW